MVKLKYIKCAQLPARGAIFVRLDDDHLDGDGGTQEVDHLLVGERGDGHLADLHQPAALPQPRLPGEAKGLHVGHDAFEVDMETQLAQAVATQDHLHEVSQPLVVIWNQNANHFTGSQEHNRAHEDLVCLSLSLMTDCTEKNKLKCM